MPPRAVERLLARASRRRSRVHSTRQTTELREHEAVLEDGFYDAIVLDVVTHDDRSAWSLTITTGAHKGEVVDLRRAPMSEATALEMLAMPCRLVVSAGLPSLEIGENGTMEAPPAPASRREAAPAEADAESTPNGI